MPVTWCYAVEGEKTYCSPGFPVGCFVDAKKRAKDACVISPTFNQPNTVYLFNHVEETGRHFLPFFLPRILNLVKEQQEHFRRFFNYLIQDDYVYPLENGKLVAFLGR